MKQDIRFPEQKSGHIQTFYYTTEEEPRVVHIFSEINVYEERGKGRIEQINEGIGKDRPLLPDVILVRPEKNEREYQVEGKGRSGKKDETVGHHAPDACRANDPVQGERCKGVDGEKVGGERYEKIRFGQGDPSAPVAGMKIFYLAAEEHGE